MILELLLAITVELEFRNSASPPLPNVYSAGLELARQSGDRLREQSFLLRQRLLLKGTDSFNALKSDELDFVWKTLERERAHLATMTSTTDLERLRYVTDIFGAMRYANGSQGSPEYVLWAKRLLEAARDIEASFPGQLVEAQRQLAIMFVSHGDTAKAKELLAQSLEGAVKVRPQSIFILHVTRGWAEMQAGDFEAASRSYDLALPLRTAHAATARTSLYVVLRAAKMKQKLGEWKRARELLSDAQQEVPMGDTIALSQLDSLLALQHLHTGEVRIASQKIESGESNLKHAATGDKSEARALLDEARLRLAIATGQSTQTVNTAMTTLVSNQRRATALDTPQLAAIVSLLDTEDRENKIAVLEREKSAAALETWRAESRRSSLTRLSVLAILVVAIGLGLIFFYRRPASRRN